MIEFAGLLIVAVKLEAEGSALGPHYSGKAS